MSQNYNSKLSILCKRELTSFLVVRVQIVNGILDSLLWDELLQGSVNQTVKTYKPQSWIPE